MTADDSGAALARQALQALRRLDDQGLRLAPAGVDRFAWAADVLDELARCSGLIASAVGHASGIPSAAVEHRAAELATAIVAHRNSLLGGGADHPLPASGDAVETAGRTTSGERAVGYLSA